MAKRITLDASLQQDGVRTDIQAGIRRLIEDSKVTPEALSVALGKSAFTIRQYNTNSKGQGRIQFLVDLAEELGYNVSIVLTERDHEAPPYSERWMQKYAPSDAPHPI